MITIHALSIALWVGSRFLIMRDWLGTSTVSIVWAVLPHPGWGSWIAFGFQQLQLLCILHNTRKESMKNRYNLLLYKSRLYLFFILSFLVLCRMQRSCNCWKPNAIHDPHPGCGSTAHTILTVLVPSQSLIIRNLLPTHRAMDRACMVITLQEREKETFVRYSY